MRDGEGLECESGGAGWDLVGGDAVGMADYKCVKKCVMCGC